MKAGETHRVFIERAADMGRGIAHVDGMAVFVKNALPNETVEAVIERVEKKAAFGRATAIENPFPTRKEPFCESYLTCGGCDMQHMDYETQLSQKGQTVLSALCRIGGFLENSFELLPVLPAQAPLHYRNKAVFSVSGKPGNAKIGFYQKQSHALVPAGDCRLQSPLANAAAGALISWMNRHKVAPCDQITGDGLIKGLMVRTNRRGEALAVPIAKSASLPNQNELIQALLEAVPSLTGVVLNINPEKNAEALGREDRLLYGSPTLSETLLGLSFSISAQSFFQVNPAQAERLFQSALDLSGLSGEELVVDAYCGAGAISLLLAKRAKEVIGVEASAPAVRDAVKNAQANGIHNARFIEGRCEEVLPRLIEGGLRPDLISLDPPRKGCDAALLAAIAAAAPKKICYVSCNPSTLARDLKTLCAGEYMLKRVQPVDMFPWTGNIECVALLLRQTP